MPDADLYVGLMSGTSMDGIDAVLVQFDGSRNIKLLASKTTPYSNALAQKLKQILSQKWRGSLHEILEIDSQIGLAFANAANTIIGDHKNQIAAIGMHGQTLWHQPEAAIPSTWQAGNPALVAEICECSVIADWRRRDMAAGGQGAPLAPVFHQAFFKQDQERLGILNLGGIANLTVLEHGNNTLIGFDTGPANTLMDKWCQRHRGKTFDKNGEWAAKGDTLEPLLKALLEDEYFQHPLPKSTGPERFNLEWLEAKLQELADRPDPTDVQRTLLTLTIESIALQLERYCPDVQRLLLCGGGSHNTVLIEQLNRRLPAIQIETTATEGVDPDFLEAIAFAWFAQQTLTGVPLNTAAVTGARGPRRLGAIYPA